MKPFYLRVLQVPPPSPPNFRVILLLFRAIPERAILADTCIVDLFKHSARGFSFLRRLRSADSNDMAATCTGLIFSSTFEVSIGTLR